MTLVLCACPHIRPNVPTLSLADIEHTSPMCGLCLHLVVISRAAIYTCFSCSAASGPLVCCSVLSRQLSERAFLLRNIVASCGRHSTTCGETGSIGDAAGLPVVEQAQLHLLIVDDFLLPSAFSWDVECPRVFVARLLRVSLSATCQRT